MWDRGKHRANEKPFFLLKIAVPISQTRTSDNVAINWYSSFRLDLDGHGPTDDRVSRRGRPLHGGREISG